MLEVFADLCPATSLSEDFTQDKFLFIFDGLDELGFKINLFDQCHLQAWSVNSVFIITSHPLLEMHL